ncbi:tail fiber domain-containing protein [Enterobacter asburiae]|uniref:tail fiber domain-containing protein n=1 Tax=Enterobacter asburiae TaxID=61645 RepID=UPI0026478E0E|nr:tail fiber domain-containing protein [Enterobacter asburiae]WKE03341.1 tail fiber domain-containing protein [Enterobacter asburiae]WKE10890.1 tail fiber domain-containing protein [Enterobacter asburiae]
MIYTTGTIAISGNTLTGTGTNFTAAGSLIRNGCTVIALTSPAKVFQITAIGGATSLTVTPAANPAIPAGTKYAILLSDSLSVDGLAQDIAETFTMYQRYMSGFADVMNGTTDVTITINGVAVTVPGQKSLAKKGANSDITSLSGLTTALSISQGGTGSTTAAGARGNLGITDKQLNSVDGKTGGNITSAVSSPGFIAGSSPTPSAQGHYFGWNEYGDGAAILQNNRGGGSGGFRFRTVNSTNTAEISVFHLAYTGVGYAPGGWQTGSDERIKEDIKDIDPDFALNAVLKLRHVTFKMRDRPDGDGGWVTGERSVGYLAQDLEQYLPDAVNTAEISDELPGYRCRGENNELLVVEGMKSIDPGKAGAALNGAAIKALYRIMNDENAELRNEISGLKEMIKGLMDQPSAGNH